MALRRLRRLLPVVARVRAGPETELAAAEARVLELAAERLSDGGYVLTILRHPASIAVLGVDAEGLLERVTIRNDRPEHATAFALISQFADDLHAWPPGPRMRRAPRQVRSFRLEAASGDLIAVALDAGDELVLVTLDDVDGTALPTALLTRHEARRLADMLASLVVADEP